MKPFKVIALFAALNMIRIAAAACGVCDNQQPRIFRGFSHGQGPDTKWDYLIVAFVVCLVLVTFFYSVKWLVKPGENSSTHIKNLILITE